MIALANMAQAVPPSLWLLRPGAKKKSLRTQPPYP
jgi:hypothetical protein